MIRLTICILIILVLFCRIDIRFIILIPVALMLLKPQGTNKPVCKNIDDIIIDAEYIINQIVHNTPLMYSYRSFDELSELGFIKAPIYKLNCFNEKDFQYLSRFVSIIDRLHREMLVNVVVVTNENYRSKIHKIDYVLDINLIDLNVLSLVNSFDINLPYRKNIELKKIYCLGSNEYKAELLVDCIVYHIDNQRITRYVDYTDNSCFLLFQGYNKEYLDFVFTERDSLYFVEKIYQGYQIKDLYGSEVLYVITNFKYIGTSVVRSSVVFQVSDGYFYLTKRMSYYDKSQILSNIKSRYLNINRIIINDKGMDVFNNYLPKQIREQYFINPYKYVKDFKNFLYGYKSLPCDIRHINSLYLKNKDLSCYYNYIRFELFGIYILPNGIRFLPKIDANIDLTIMVRQKCYNLKLLHTGKSVLYIDNTKYHNINYVTYEMIENGAVISF